MSTKGIKGICEEFSKVQRATYNPFKTSRRVTGTVKEGLPFGNKNLLSFLRNQLLSLIITYSVQKKSKNRARNTS